MTIGVLMIACLLAALALAQALMVRKPSTYEWTTVRPADADFEFDVPADWQAVEMGDADKQLRFISAYRDPNHETHLIVASLRDTTTRSHDRVLAEALHALHARSIPIAKSKRTGSIRRLRHGTWITLRQMRQSRTHYFDVAIVARNARRYWAIVRAEQIDPENPRILNVVDSLVESVCRSIKSRVMRAPTPSQLRDAGWGAASATLPQRLGAKLLVEAAHRKTDPLWLIGDRGPNNVRILRILVTPDATTGDEGVHLSPIALLQQEHRLASGQSPAGQVRKITVGNHQATVALMVDTGDLRGRWERTLWFVPLDDGRAALLELLGPTAERDARRQWVAPVLNALAGERADGSPRAQVEAARQQGIELARRMRREFGPTVQAGRRYYQYERDGWFIGCGTASMERSGEDQQLPLHGHSSTLLLDNSNRKIHLEWSTNDDLSAALLDRRDELIVTAGLIRTRQRMEIYGDQLVITRRRDGTPGQRLSPVRLPSSYIPPMAEDIWPGELLRRWRSRAAVVWLSRGMRSPTPCWMTIDVTDYGRLVVSLRPLMSLDSSDHTLDESGFVMQTRQRVDGHALGGPQLTVRQTSRDELMRTRPDLVKSLGQLEKETFDRHDADNNNGG